MHASDLHMISEPTAMSQESFGLDESSQCYDSPALEENRQPSITGNTRKIGIEDEGVDILKRRRDQNRAAYVSEPRNCA